MLKKITKFEIQYLTQYDILFPEENDLFAAGVRGGSGFDDGVPDAGVGGRCRGPWGGGYGLVMRMYMRHFALAAMLVTFVAASLGAADKQYRLTSPSGELAVEITAGAQTSWSLDMCGARVLEPSAISMTLDDGTVFGRDMKVRKAVRRSMDGIVTPVVYRRSQVREA